VKPSPSLKFWPLRLAREDDVPALEALIPLSVRTLQAPRTVSLVATLAGEPLYAAFGYLAAERYEIPLAGGLSLPAVRMTKSIKMCEG
jgi:hypothetical protein